MADTYTDLTNLRGPAARIVAVDTEALPAGAEPTVEMVGPDQGRMFTFGIPAGMPASAAVPQDAAVGGFIGTAGTASQIKTDERVYRALARTTAPVVTIQDGVDGIVGGTTVDNTAAIQAKINAAGRGGKIVLLNPGASRAIRIDSTLFFNHGQQTFEAPGDPYNLSLWTNAQNITMMEARSPGNVFDGLVLNSAFDRATSQSIGLKLYGTVEANIDSEIRNSVFMGLNRGVEMHGKNLKVRNSTFSNGNTGIWVGGQLVGYHTSWESRNLIAKDNRFHGMGLTESHASINISAESVHSGSQIQDNFFDMFGRGIHIAVVGTSTAKQRRIKISGNQHDNVYGTCMYIVHTERSSIADAQIAGVGGTAPTGNAVHLNNTNSMDLNGITVLTHNIGFRFENSTHLMLNALNSNSNLLDGFYFGAGLARVGLNGIVAFANVNYGLTGSAAIGNPYKGLIAAYSNAGGDINPVLGLA